MNFPSASSISGTSTPEEVYSESGIKKHDDELTKEERNAQYAAIQHQMKVRKLAATLTAAVALKKDKKVEQKPQN